MFFTLKTRAHVYELCCMYNGLCVSCNGSYREFAKGERLGMSAYQRKGEVRLIHTHALCCKREKEKLKGG